jgi:very-short-patch-repair endonuclease
MLSRRIDPEQKENARGLRQNQAPAEKIMWKLLRGRRFAGFKFRRQHPVGAYIVDFVCLDALLIIELDGESHLERGELDQHRDRWLASQGFMILRFWNTEVFDEGDPVKEKIWQECSARMPSRR